MNSTDESRRKTIAQRLRIARERSGLSQGQTAKRLNMHRPTISEIEAARRKVRAEELTAFADLYGVDIQWLTDTADEGNNEQVARIQIAARELSKLKDEDLDRVLDLLASLRRSERK